LQIVECLDAQGTNPYKKLYDSLDPQLQPNCTGARRARSRLPRCAFQRGRAGVARRRPRYCQGSAARINATTGFEKLAAATGIPVKSVMRMFGPNGNRTAANMFAVIRVLQKKTGVHLEVHATASAA
jgi:hypothetical protein